MGLNLFKTKRALQAAACSAVFCAAIVTSPGAAPLLPVNVQDIGRDIAKDMAQDMAQDSTQNTNADKKPKKHTLKWDPPEVDAPVKGVSDSPPCDLPRVLEQTGARVAEMFANLQNFTASERIEYEHFDEFGSLRQSQKGTFDYLVNFNAVPQGFAIQETRNPAKGTDPFAASSADNGLPEMALIFLPRVQADYSMTCQGAGAWNGRPAWVIHFQQRKDMPEETISFTASNQVIYHAQLKGRAWIDVDTGEVTHLETALMAAIPLAHIRDWSLSIDYAPIQFHTQNVTIWLPQTVDAYSEAETGRTRLYHEFSNFMLFSVRTNQVIEKPKE